MYPAPLVHVFRVLLSVPHSLKVFLFLCLLVPTIFSLVFIRRLHFEGLSWRTSILFVTATAVLSYPLLFLLQRGNIEILIWCVCTVGIWCFFKGQFTVAAVLIGLAASLKLYPIVFLGLFLPSRKYRQFVIGIAFMALVTVLSLYAIGPTIGAAAKWDSIQIQAFSKYYAARLWALGYDHSFFGLIKLVTLPWRPNLTPWIRPYTAAVAAISIALYFVRIWRIPIANQILALSILSVTLAPVSYDYTLLNLYPAFGIIALLSVRAKKREIVIPHIGTLMILFALVFTPESYIVFYGVRFGAQFRCICLILMLYFALKTPIEDITSESAPFEARA